jgi:hypothetical protein
MPLPLWRCERLKLISRVVTPLQPIARIDKQLPEPLSHDMHRLTSQEQQRGRHMSQVVKPDPA